MKIPPPPLAASSSGRAVDLSDLFQGLLPVLFIGSSLFCSYSLPDLILIVSQSGLLDGEWVREMLGVSPQGFLRSVVDFQNMPEGARDEDSLKVLPLRGLPRSQSMKVLSLLIGSLMLAVMLSNAAYSSWTRKGKSEQPHMNRDKRCHDRLSITIFPDVGNQILLSVSRANTRSSTRATPLTLETSETL